MKLLIDIQGNKPLSSYGDNHIIAYNSETKNYYVTTADSFFAGQNAKIKKMAEYCTKKVAVIFVIKQGNEYLFQKRTHTGAQDGWYMMPGGHVDEGESVLRAAVRELKEELDIVVAPEDLKFKLVKPEKSHISFFFEVKKFQGEIKNNEPGKHGDLRFLPISHLEIYPSIAREVEALEKGESFLEMVSDI